MHLAGASTRGEDPVGCSPAFCGDPRRHRLTSISRTHRLVALCTGEFAALIPLSASPSLLHHLLGRSHAAAYQANAHRLRRRGLGERDHSSGTASEARTAEIRTNVRREPRSLLQRSGAGLNSAAEALSSQPSSAVPRAWPRENRQAEAEIEARTRARRQSPRTPASTTAPQNSEHPCRSLVKYGTEEVLPRGRGRRREDDGSPDVPQASASRSRRPRAHCRPA